MKKRSLRSSSLVPLAVALTAVMGSSASAQEAAPAEAATDDALPGEIVITANKRVQALNDVGITVSVLGSEQLAERRIASLADIAATIPGLTFSSSENNTPVFTLRGIGFNEASLAAYPTVSVYVDEAPLAFPVLSGQGAFDLERIEVLKGPQGTLFGQNSTGGAINYIAAKPTNTLSAGTDVSYSRFNTFEANGFVSGPLSDTLKVRLAGHYLHSGDWQRSYTRDDTIGKSEVYAGRFITNWAPTSRLRFALTVNAWKDKSDPQAGQYIALYPQIPAFLYPSVAAYPFSPQTPRAADWSYGTAIGPNGNVLDPTPYADRRLWQGILRGDFDLTDDITLTSLTSYVDFKQKQALDYDGLAINNDDIPVNDGDIKSWFQELRLANGNQSNIRWVVGANVQRSRIHEDDAISYSVGTTSNPTLNNIVQNGFFSNTLRRDYAAFGNVEVDILPKLTLKAGARYTDSLTSVNICNVDRGDGRINGVINTLITFFSATPTALIGPDDCATLDANFNAGPPFVDRLKQNNTSWRFGLDFKPTDDLLIYANVSRGFKAGSYPTISASSESQYVPVTQEKVTAYEAGFKLTTLDRAFSLNGAAFYYDYVNKQIRGKTKDPFFGVLNALVNVPKSRLYGAELEAALRPVDGLTISGTMTYVDSKVQRYTGINVLGLEQNFAGSPIPFAPKWQGLVSVDYRSTVGAFEPFVGADINMRSKTTSYIGGNTITLPASPVNSTAPGAERPFVIDSYTTVDLRAGAEWDDGRWRAMVWGKNVFNKYYWTNVISAFDTVYRTAGRPATYGITVAHKF